MKPKEESRMADVQTVEVHDKKWARKFFLNGSGWNRLAFYRLCSTVGVGSHDPFLDPIILLALFQLKEILICVINFLQFVLCINPTTFGGGGFLARTIRLSTTTLKWLYLAAPTLVTFCFYLLDTFWQNFSKIN